MLRNFPLNLGLTFCEDVVRDPATGNVSVIRAFTGLRQPSFPAVARPFCAFAAFTNGEGEADSVLTVTCMSDEIEEVWRVRRRLRFPDPLQTVYYVMRLSNCPLPRPGAYFFTLWLDGWGVAQRTLRVSLSGVSP